MEEVPRFKWPDYVVLVIALLLSSAVGIFYGWKDRKKKSLEVYLMGGRKMHFLPICASMFVSWISAISFLGDPVEVYYRGSVYLYLILGYALAPPVVAIFITPIFYEMKLMSVYQYLEMRFTRQMRPFIAAVDTIGGMCFLGVVLYAPSVALSHVSGLEVWVTILIVGGVCVFYTTLGGMKAVVWADTIQMIIMVIGMITTLVVGTAKVGGIGEVWSRAESVGRINFNNFSPNPLTRSTFWTYFIGGFFRVFNPFAGKQAFVQRMCASKTKTQAQIAVCGTSILFLLFGVLFLLTGLLMAAYYGDCDPLLSGKISKPDQMMPFLILDTLGQFPGLPGLFMACVFSASLSTLSTMQNGFATVICAEYVMPLYNKITGKQIQPNSAKWIASSLSITAGLLSVTIALLLIVVKNQTLFELSFKIIGIIIGPSMGIFIVGILLPFINTPSICLAGIGCLTINLWLGIGSLFYGTPAKILPISAVGCIDNSSLSSGTPLNATQSDVTSSSSINIYNFSTALYPLLGPFLILTLSLLFLPITKLVRKCRENTNEYEEVVMKT